MDKKILVLVAVIAVLALFFVLKQDYRPFTLDGDCVTYTQECTCYGSLITFESYPPKFECRGLNFCKEINIVECGFEEVVSEDFSGY